VRSARNCFQIAFNFLALPQPKSLFSRTRSHLLFQATDGRPHPMPPPQPAPELSARTAERVERSRGRCCTPVPRRCLTCAAASPWTDGVSRIGLLVASFGTSIHAITGAASQSPIHRAAMNPCLLEKKRTLWLLFHRSPYSYTRVCCSPSHRRRLVSICTVSSLALSWINVHLPDPCSFFSSGRKAF
jgi:hypothetical protein